MVLVASHFIETGHQRQGRKHSPYVPDGVERTGFNEQFVVGTQEMLGDVWAYGQFLVGSDENGILTKVPWS